MALDDTDPSAAADGLKLNKKGTATGAALAATLHKPAGTITTESLATAALTDISYVVTNNKVTASSIVLAQLSLGSNSAGSPVVLNVTPAAGSFTVVIRNAHASAALNGTLKINFAVL